MGLKDSEQCLVSGNELGRVRKKTDAPECCGVGGVRRVSGNCVANVPDIVWVCTLQTLSIPTHLGVCWSVQLIVIDYNKSPLTLIRESLVLETG